MSPTRLAEFEPIRGPLKAPAQIAVDPRNLGFRTSKIKKEGKCARFVLDAQSLCGNPAVIRIAFLVGLLEKVWWQKLPHLPLMLKERSELINQTRGKRVEAGTFTCSVPLNTPHEITGQLGDVTPLKVLLRSCGCSKTTTRLAFRNVLLLSLLSSSPMSFFPSRLFAFLFLERTSVFIRI